MAKTTPLPTTSEQVIVAPPVVTPPARADLDRALSELPGENSDPEYVIKGMRSHFGELFTDADEMTVRDLFALPAATSKTESAALIKARVLTACTYGKPDDVVEVTIEEAAASPDLDAHPDAVAYAESLTA